MALTIERAGLALTLIFSGYAAFQTYRNTETVQNLDANSIIQQVTKTNEGLDLVVAKQAETDQTISQLRADTDLVTYRDCIVENVVRSVIGDASVSLKACKEEGKTWMEEKALLDDSEEVQ